MTPIDIASYQHIVVLTGAGISVASGLRAYRGPGGVWTEGGDEHLATAPPNPYFQETYLDAAVNLVPQLLG